MEATSTASSAASSVDGRNTGGTGSDYLNLGMFSGSGATQQGELLVGGAGFGGGSALNGFGNDAQAGATPPGTTPGTSFDLSDFPSLGGTSNNNAGGNGLAAALRQQQQMLAHQQMLGAQQQQQAPSSKSSNLYRLAMTGTNGNFNMATEDFPALSGAPQNASPGGTTLNPSGSSLLSSSSQTGGRAASNQSGIYGSSDLDNGNVGSQLDGGSGLLGGAGLGGLGGLRGLQQPHNASSVPRAPSSSAPASAGVVGGSSGGGSGSAAGNALSGDYGLLGLLGVIRMTDADRNALALGSDLNMLGLNLGPAEQLYSTFSSPWSDTAASKDPHYQVGGRDNNGHLQFVSLSTKLF